MHEDRTRYAAAARRVEAVLHGDIIVDDDVVRLDVLILRHVDGHLEVQHIARVVLDDAEDAGVGRNCLDALVDLIRRRRGEYRPRDRRVEHALADVAAVRRLMTAAAARDERDLSLFACLADDDVAGLEFLKLLRTRFDESLDHFLFDIFDLVDELFHRR